MRRLLKNRSVWVAGLILVVVAGVLLYMSHTGDAVQAQESLTMKMLTVRP
ncbi:MAG: hypothetical protein AAF694_22935 [Bacteroidota bacterium]